MFDRVDFAARNPAAASTFATAERFFQEMFSRAQRGESILPGVVTGNSSPPAAAPAEGNCQHDPIAWAAGSGCSKCSLATWESLRRKFYFTNLMPTNRRHGIDHQIAEIIWHFLQSSDMRAALLCVLAPELRRLVEIIVHRELSAVLNTLMAGSKPPIEKSGETATGM